MVGLPLIPAVRRQVDVCEGKLEAWYDLSYGYRDTLLQKDQTNINNNIHSSPNRFEKNNNMEIGHIK